MTEYLAVPIALAVLVLLPPVMVVLLKHVLLPFWIRIDRLFDEHLGDK